MTTGVFTSGANPLVEVLSNQEPWGEKKTLTFNPFASFNSPNCSNPKTCKAPAAAATRQEKDKSQKKDCFHQRDKNSLFCLMQSTLRSN